MMKKDKNVEIKACFRSPKNENIPAGKDILKHKGSSTERCVFRQDCH